MKKIIILMIVFCVALFFYPTLSLGNAKPKPTPPQINSDAAIVLEGNTGKVLYEKNADTSLYPASLTKIATAIYAIEEGDLDDKVTVSERAYLTGGSSVYLEEGDRVKLDQLIKGFLFNSGNDAGVAIAEHLSGSVEQFTVDLNEYLKERTGIQSTEFTNPHGLFDSDHTTTARDLAKITQYAMKNDKFNQIYGMKKLDWDGEKWDATLYSHHKLMREDPYEGIVGGKTGYVPESGFTLATSASRKDTSLIVITLNSPRQNQAYEDTKELLDYGFEHYETSSLTPDFMFREAKEDFILPSEVAYTHLKDSFIDMKLENGHLVLYENGSEVKRTKVEEVPDEKLASKAKVEKLGWKAYLPYFIFPKRFWVAEIYQGLK